MEQPLPAWDDLTSSKLRLMCSYNGHILPRPHDKSLCYMGGDTRIVVVDRNSSLSSLITRLSNTLLNGNHRSFTLKYQLPNEDLDSLISVTTDEDIDNMIEEYDRTMSSNKPSRLRLFLFASTQSMGQMFFTQPVGHAQYQTMTGHPHGMVLPDGSAAAKLPAENMTTGQEFTGTAIVTRYKDDGTQFWRKELGLFRNI